MINKKDIIKQVNLLISKNNLPIVASIIAVILSIFAIANTDKRQSNAFIDVNGMCLKRIEKDRYKTEVIIKFTDKTSSGVALSKSKKLFTELTEFVDKLKIDDKTLTTQTSKIEVLEEKTWSNKKEKYINEGYSAQMAMEVSSENSESLSKIITFASKKNNILIDRIESYVSNQKLKIEKELCLAEAIKNAKDQAKYMTEAAGNRVGKLVSVYVKTTNNNMPETFMMKSNFIKDANEIEQSSSIIQQSGYDMNVVVHARFEIK